MTRQATDPPPSRLVAKKNGILLLAISRMVLDGFSRRKVVQGHAGDVPMHRLPTQLLLSSGDTILFCRDTQLELTGISLPEFRGGGGGHNVPYTRYPEIGILGRFWLKCQESLAE